MLRTALRPANLGLLAVMLAAAVVFSVLGEWQLGRSREHARVSPTEVVVPLDDVLQPAADFTGHADHQRVDVTGTWAALPVEVVTGRPLGGLEGQWVVAALQVDGTGGLLPVVLGWQPAGSTAPEAPSGEADLTGRLQASEEAQGIGPDGELSVVSSADLVNVWPGRLYTGFLLPDAGPSAGLTAVPSPAPTLRLDPQNLSYAFQWWLFGAFALVLWVKVVRDRHHDELEDERAAQQEERAEEGDRAVGPTWEDGAVPPAPDAMTPDDAHEQRGVRS